MSVRRTAGTAHTRAVPVGSPALIKVFAGRTFCRTLLRCVERPFQRWRACKIMAAQRQLLVFGITPSFWVWVIYLLAAARADALMINLSELLNGLVRRVVGEESYAQAWLGAVEWVEERGVEGKDSTQQYFNVGPSSKSTAAVRIGGSDRVALAAGFYHYLKICKWNRYLGRG